MLIFKKEERVRDLVLDHLNQVHKCLKQSRNSLKAYLAEDQEATVEVAKVVNETESKADSLAREIREALLDGAFLPNIRSDVYRLVEAVDSIAGAAEEISQFIVGESLNIPSEFHAGVLEVYIKSLKCFEQLRKALKTYFKPKGMFEDLREHFTKVCDLESEADKVQAELTKSVFASSLPLSEKLHLQQLIEKIGDIADLSEDAADELEFAAMKVVF